MLYNYLYPELANLTSLPTRLTSRGTAGERLGHYLSAFREESDNLLCRQTLSSLFMFPRNEGMSLNFPVVAYTLYSRVITTFLFAKVASAGMTAKHRCPIFPDSLWQPSHFITKMGIPYTLPKNYLLFIPMALTAFLGKEKVYTRQDMGIKKSSHESSNRTKEKCLTTLRKSI